MTATPDIRSMEDKFWAKVQKGEPDECWEWKGSRNQGGYGKFRISGGYVLAHRHALSLSLGRPITPGLFCAHSCDNPPCVNPAHLREATHRENVMDMVSRDRQARWNGLRMGEGNPKAKLTALDVVAIRNSPLTSTEVAKHYGVSRITIVDIRHRTTWKSVL